MDDVCYANVRDLAPLVSFIYVALDDRFKVVKCNRSENENVADGLK